MTSCNQPGLTCIGELLERAREGIEPDVDGRRPARAWAREHGRLREVQLRAVLERTCVVAAPAEEHVRWLVRHSEVLVDEQAIAWRPVAEQRATLPRGFMTLLDAVTRRGEDGPTPRAAGGR